MLYIVKFTRAHHSERVHSFDRVGGGCEGLLSDIREGRSADGLGPLDLEGGGGLGPRILSIFGVLHPS